MYEITKARFKCTQPHWQTNDT